MSAKLERIQYQVLMYAAGGGKYDVHKCNLHPHYVHMPSHVSRSAIRPQLS